MFLTPARREAQERVVRRRLAGTGITLLIGIVVFIAVGPLLDRLIHTGPSRHHDKCDGSSKIKPGCSIAIIHGVLFGVDVSAVEDRKVRPQDR